jgi:hypothetical protein
MHSYERDVRIKREIPMKINSYFCALLSLVAACGGGGGNKSNGKMGVSVEWLLVQ